MRVLNIWSVTRKDGSQKAYLFRIVGKGRSIEHWVEKNGLAIGSNWISVQFTDIFFGKSNQTPMVGRSLPESGCLTFVHTVNGAVLLEIFCSQ